MQQVLGSGVIGQLPETERPHLSLVKQTPQVVYHKSQKRRQKVSLNYYEFGFFRVNLV